MDFVCLKDDLVRGVRLASYALGTRSSMPILAGLKMEIGEKELRLQATDLERAVRYAIPIENTGGEEAVVLNGAVFNQIASHLPADEKISLTTDAEDGTMVKVRCGEASFDLPTLPIEDYPEIPPLPDAKVASVQAAEFHRGLEQTGFAALKAGETTRLNLTGVNLVLKGEHLKMVATNGYRLAVKTIAVDQMHEEGEYLIEASVLTDLDRVLSQVGPASVELFRGEGQLFFRAGDVTFMARTIAEEFPDFERVIPQDNPIALDFDRKAFMEALQRIEITAAEDSGAITLHASSDESAVQIDSSSKDKGKAQERVRLKKVPGESVEISFRGEYIVDALKRLDSEEIKLWLAAPEKAGLIEPSGETIPDADHGFLYVCMPVRLST
jgi:DNA polymerase-3 subunit beta